MTDHIVESNKKVIDLDALEKLADEATPGPWTIDPDDQWDDGTNLPEQLDLRVNGSRWGKVVDAVHISDADAAYIAAVNPATMDALISELREARGLLKSWVATAEAEYVEGLFYDNVKETRAFLSKAQGGE